MATLDLDRASLAEQAMRAASIKRDELALAVMISLDCGADSLESLEARLPGKVLWWIGLKDGVTLNPRNTEFHRRHGIPENASLLDYVVIAGFRDLRFRVSVRHRHCTPELREFFEQLSLRIS